MDKTKNVEKMVERGAELVGAAAGGAIGFVVGGPVGAALGGAATPLIVWSVRKMGQEFSERMLSPREEARVGAGLLYASSKIAEYLQQGRVPRDDGFFVGDASARSASDEILEGVLLKCKTEHEEKKLRLIGNIYANVAFMPEVAATGANWLLQKSQHLTYRQLCIVALVKRANQTGASWGSSDGDPAFEMEYKDIDYMFQRDDSPGSVKRHQRTGEGMRIIGLSRTGQFCYNLMGLEDIPDNDLRDLKPHFPRAFA
jgi:hypothetical protein